MNIDKVIFELGELTADPFEKELAQTLIKRLNQVKEGKKPIFGWRIFRLLEMAENGEFK